VPDETPVPPKTNNSHGVPPNAETEFLTLEQYTTDPSPQGQPLPDSRLVWTEELNRFRKFWILAETWLDLQTRRIGQ
jgi:hypothetical protein